VSDALFPEEEGLVICTQVRDCDPPQFIAEDLDGLRANFPGEWSGEQCDGCGCVVYRVERIPGTSVDPSPLTRRLGAEVLFWQVRCCGSDWDANNAKEMGADDEQVAAIRQGCGATYRLMWRRESEVCF
jgi:hypothetical protein